MAADLPTRLRQHERGARQQCTCPSGTENCMMCDLGLAADEIERLASTLATIRRILATAPYPLGPYGALGEIDRAVGRESV